MTEDTLAAAEATQPSPTATTDTTTAAEAATTSKTAATTTATTTTGTTNNTTTTNEENTSIGAEAIVPDVGDSAAPEAAAADVEDAAAPVAVVAPPTEHGYEITRFIKTPMLNELLDMGFNKIRAEKALFLTQNKSLEEAIQWIDEHSNDEDIDEVLMLCSSAGDALPTKPRLTDEEAAEKAHDLQKKLREIRVAKEREDALERERNRIASTKAAQEQQRKLEENTKKRAIDEIQRDKQAHQEERDRQRLLLKQEWEDRFGRPYEEPKEEASDDITQKPAKAQIVHWVNVMKKDYGTQDAAGLKSCLQLVCTYMTNAHDHPLEAKYRRIRMGNKAFETRVSPYTGAVELLKAVGFKPDESGEALEIVGVPDGFILGQGLKFARLVADQL